MPQCKYCGKSGFFLSVTLNGLCQQCNYIFVMDLKQRARIMQESYKIIDNSKNLSTKLSRCDTIIQHAEELLRYEQKGIPTIQPSPSELITKTKQVKEDIIIKSLEEDLERAMDKAALASTQSTKTSDLNKVILKIRDFKEILIDNNKINEIEKRANDLRHKIQLEGFLEAAKKAEFKGQKSKAIDQYQEALYFLKSDNIDDESQKEKIEEIENKIKELS